MDIRSRWQIGESRLDLHEDQRTLAGMPGEDVD
jgi:hypothetical protein